MEKREQILSAALKLFVEFGFHGTPTSKIAQEAGVSNGTLFHYFKTKDELITALYKEKKEQLGSAMEAQASQDESIKAQFRRMFVNALHWAQENTLAFHFIQQFHTSPFIALLAPEEVLQQTKRDRDLIEAGIRAEILKPLPIDFIYTIITSHIFGMNQYLLNQEIGASQREKLIKEGFEMLWKMIT